MAAQYHWMVAQSKPNCEEIAARNVRQQCHEYYLPRYWDQRLKRRRVLFVGYLFVHADPEHSQFLHGTKGVKRVLEGSVAQQEITKLKAMENEHGVIVLPQHDPHKFTTDQKLKVTGGPFLGEYALYQGMSSKHTARVLLTMLSRPVTTYVDVRLLQAA